MHNARAIIIAAGSGSRLRPLTDETPKCMLEVGRKSLIEHCIDNLQKNGIDHISIVTGYKAEKINFEGLYYYHNNNYLTNNVLHSLLYAREALEQAVKDEAPVVISYSDIWYHSSIVKSLLQSQGDINLVVDSQWESAYEGRTDHPTSEAELAVFTQENRLCAIGKNVINPASSKNVNGEFIGLLMMRPAGIKRFLSHFDNVSAHLTLMSPFQKAAEWQKSYITDILQDMVDNQVVVNCVGIEGKWKEFDTVQDFERGLPE
jgi:L-glutamine-phosphate cytidylyltransferase